MSGSPQNPAVPGSQGNGIPRVLVATTALLSFISFWRAAAIVLNDLASSAYYAGGEAEAYIGKAAPWFILGIMLFSYAVRAIYVESCSMFVRGGVYRVVKEAMGGTLAKFSVSALMFDYILTGPISGVSAGQYIVGLINETSDYIKLGLHVSPNFGAAFFAILCTVYFWWYNIKGVHESSQKAMRIMQVTTVMVVILIGWCIYTVLLRHPALPPFPHPRNLKLEPNAMGWLYGVHFAHFAGLIAIFVGLGHSVLAMSGEESLAQVYREIEHPKLPNLKKTGLVIFIYSLVFTSLVSFFAVMIIPRPAATELPRKPDWRAGHEPGRPVYFAAGFSWICGGGGHADSGRGSEYGDRGLERSAQPRFRRRRAVELVPAAAPEVRHLLPDHQHHRRAANCDHHYQPWRCDVPCEPVRIRRDLELRDEGHGGAGAAVHASRGSRISRAAKLPYFRRGNSAGPGR